VTKTGAQPVRESMRFFMVPGIVKDGHLMGRAGRGQLLN
jgi:hypothetical protein